MDNEKRIMDAFIKAGKPLSAKEASELSGLEKKEVDKLIKKLKDGGKLESPKRFYYQPK
jgi:chromosome segregation and condensation protein ScpB